MDATVRALMALARAKAATVQDEDDDHHRAAAVLLLAALAAWFGSRPAISSTELPGELIARLVAYGFTHRAAVEAGKLASYPPLTGRGRYGSPQPVPDMTTARRVASEEPEMRAEFVVASADRLTEAEATDSLEQQLEAERRYRDMHVAMGRRRRWAAQRLDEVTAKATSGWMVWRCGTHPEAVCAALRGRIFPVDNPPGLPGAMHLNCQCWAEPWGGPAPG